MVTLKWCMRHKKGVKLVEPNDNLCKEYLATAEETLDVLRNIRGRSRVWLATTKYYSEYFAVYALLMKLGLKCEIHECTIALCGVLEGLNVLPQGTQKRLEDDKQLRVDNQYYLKNREVPLSYDDLLGFVLTVKDITTRISREQIAEIRTQLRKVMR